VLQSTSQPYDAIFHRSDDEKSVFLNELPAGLRIELSYLMHRYLVDEIEFFKGKPERFVAMIGPLLKPVRIPRGEFVFTEGEYADESSFLITLSDWNSVLR
jgi:hypothetical protein